MMIPASTKVPAICLAHGGEFATRRFHYSHISIAVSVLSALHYSYLLLSQCNIL
ncbi:hypothetical protein NA56DRAFT_649946 [Hyaloscypha hepaticicola]|uniref:Uncharacterized protein n=1 Tax=Hyaloscypha hepaticicola TaxID=2082293 RepID=A0A2J6PNS5_9HELO|nr:hypothetical protein NA56DRAFT_649946 [Hyaloscypha hepaticicola]